jgi:hypothetical protein
LIEFAPPRQLKRSVALLDVMNETLVWVRFAAMIAIFVGTCFGLGYLTGYLGRRRAWPGWVIGLISVAIGFMWPAIIVGVAVYGARTYRPRYEGDPADAPAMVLVSAITVGVPLLFAFGFPLALGGVAVARRGLRS